MKHQQENDLISRAALIEFIRNVPVMKKYKNFMTLFVVWVNQQPTAYDIDEVTKQLEEAKLYSAIEIVKGGVK